MTYMNKTNQSCYSHKNLNPVKETEKAGKRWMGRWIEHPILVTILSSKVTPKSTDESTIIHSADVC